MHNRDFNTLSEAVDAYKRQGYTYNFNLVGNKISCKEMEEEFGIEEFDVERVLRFEGESSTGDSSILYIINARSGLKGTLVDAYGMYSGQVDSELLKKLNIH